MTSDRPNKDDTAPQEAEQTPEQDLAAGPTGDAPEAGADAAPSEIDGLKAEIADLKDRLLRQMAETDNVRKRAEREKQEAARYGLGPFARDLLGVADNLSRAIEAVSAEHRDQEAVKPLLEGVEMTERELLSVFERHAIKKILPLGEAFDPNYHQAVAEVPSADAKSGTVINVAQPGYMIADRLIRPAMVVIAKASPGEGPGQSVDKSV